MAGLSPGSAGAQKISWGPTVADISCIKQSLLKVGISKESGVRYLKQFQMGDVTDVAADVQASFVIPCLQAVQCQQRSRHDC